MPATHTEIAPAHNLALQSAPQGGNLMTLERTVIKKDLGQFDAKIASYPDEVKEDVAFIFSLNQTEFSGQYAMLAHLVREQAKLNYSDQYFYQLLTGRYFRPDPNPDRKGRILGSVDNVKEIAAWLRNWAIFNAEAGGMPFIETPTFKEVLDYFDAKSAPAAVNKFGAIVGSTGTGKSRMLKRIELVRNHGSTRRMEATRGSLARFLMKFGAQFGVPLSAATSERLERINECVTSKRKIIIDNFQKLYDPKKGAVQPVIDYIMELQDDSQATIFLGWVPNFSRTIAEGKDHIFFEQLVGRLGGMDTIYELPEYTPMRDLKAIQERMQIAGGKQALAIMKAWSREPGRQRILFGRLQLAKIAAGTKSKGLTLAQLEAADTREIPASQIDEEDAS